MMADEMLTKRIAGLTARLHVSEEQIHAVLHESEARMRAIVTAAADAIITTDEKGTVQEFNSAAEEMFGYTAKEIIGKSIGLLMPDPYRDEHSEYLRRYLETGEARIIGKTRELRGRRKDGTIFPIALSLSAVDHLGYFIGIVRDMTERRALQRRIAEIATQERRLIGEELHDGLQQELTALGLLAQNLDVGSCGISRGDGSH